MSQPVFVNALGKFLPGNPISNEEMEDYLGYVGGKPSRLKSRILKQNGIATARFIFAALIFFANLFEFFN